MNDPIINETPDIPFIDMIKEQLLSADVKSQCCKNSFICGVSVFGRSRKNKYSEQINSLLEKLKHKNKKKKVFFEDDIPLGFHENEDGEKYPVGKRVCPYCEAHLLRGAFLVCGRASNTDKGVSLEMVMPSEKNAAMVKEMADKIEVSLKSTVRRGEHLLYTKKSQDIEDLLSYIGAVQASFYFMNSKIVKQLLMTVTRQTNCDANNMVKVADAAARQNEAIRAIIRNDAMKLLSPSLRVTAEIRLDNPSEPLERLAELHKEEITKSGVNHRLQKIVSFAVKNGYIT